MKGEAMRKVSMILVIGLLVLSLFSGAVSGDIAVPSLRGAYTNVTADEVKGMIEANQKTLLLDIRTLDDFSSGHLSSARCVPLSELKERIVELDKDRVLIVYCNSGMKSKPACEILAENGFETVYNMLGGIKAWTAAGFAVTTPSLPSYTSSEKNSVDSMIDRFLNANKPVFLFFYADWCHFCQQQKPIIDELEQEYVDKIVFIRVNAEENPQAMNGFSVDAFPAMFSIVDKNEGGYVYQEFGGFTEKDVLKESFDYVVENVSEDISYASDTSNQAGNNSLSSEIDDVLDSDKPVIQASASTSNGIVINEIMSNPVVGDSGKEWIEILNPTNETKNINGWMISNRTGTTVATLPDWDFPSGTYLVVHFGNGTNDNNFTDGNGHFFTNDSIEVFTNTEDECALYNSTPGISSIIDFASWCSDGSYSGGTAHNYAVNAGIWDSGDYFDTNWTENGVLYGGRYGGDIPIQSSSYTQDELKAMYIDRLDKWFKNFGKGYCYKNWASLGDIKKAKARLNDSDVQIYIDPKLCDKEGATALYIDICMGYPWGCFHWNNIILRDTPDKVDPKALWHELIHAIIDENEEHELFLVPHQDIYTWYMESSEATTEIQLSFLERKLREYCGIPEWYARHVIAVSWKDYEDRMKKNRKTGYGHMTSDGIKQSKRWTGFDIDPKKIKQYYESGSCERKCVDLDTGICIKMPKDVECSRKTGCMGIKYRCINGYLMPYPYTCTGCDHPDDNHDISTIGCNSYYPRISSGNPHSNPEIGVLSSGFPTSILDLMVYLNESGILVDIDVSSEELNNYSILVIPSGGMFGLDSSKSFKYKLEQYVINGGTLIVFSQQHGYEYNVLPGGEVSGYGWLEDQSCQYRSVAIDTYHPIHSGQDSVTLDVVVDGYFTKYPENATILLTRTKNGMPAMLMYTYGNGTVIASTIYEDWAFNRYQSTQDGRNFIRDTITWVIGPKEIPEYGTGDIFNSSADLTNLTIIPPEYPRYEPGDTINFSFNVTNPSNLTANITFVVLNPDRNESFVNIPNQIHQSETKIINFTYETNTSSKKGLWLVFYDLYNIENENFTFIEEELASKFVLINASESYYKVDFILNDPEKNVIKHESISDFPLDDLKEVNFTIIKPQKLGIWSLHYDIFSIDNIIIKSDTKKFAVSKYAENPEGFVYQGKNITFTISSPEEHYGYGSDVPFTIHIWNKGGINRDILVKTSYEDWSLRSVPLEKVNKTLNVPANGDAAYTHTVNVGDIRLSHNQLIISAEFYEDESNLGRTEKVVWMFGPSVNVHVETDQREYAKGEDVSVLLNITNKRSTACNATIKVKALDLDNNKIFENTSNINPSAYESLNKMLSFVLPSTSEYGTYVVTAEAYSNGNKIGSGSAYFEVLEDYIANVNFDKPDKSYKIREDMNIDLEVTNIGSALWESTINISIPDLAFEDSKSVSLTLNETEKFSYNLRIPENLTAGKHDVIVSISFDNSLKQYYFVIPDSNLVLSSEKTSYDASEYLYFNLTNIGGVDTTCNCSIKFYDSRGLRIYGNDTHGTILAGGTQTHSYKIPEQAVSGNYYLMVSCKDLNTNKITRLSKSYTISGLKATLTSVTDKIVYSPDENISILTNITNLDGAITNGILNLKIVCPYIQNSASKMPSSNANINRTARLKILEQKDIDIDYNYQDSMMREPHPDQMSMPINESEDFTPPLPEHYNFSFPFELEPPVEEEINESSRPQLFSSASMEIRNETVWKDEVKILNDNLIINSTGKLTLINTTLIMDCSSDGEYRIEVQKGGEMHILDKSNITAMNPLYAFCFQVRSGSTFEMRDSELHGCGFQSYFVVPNGLWINTNDAIIENNSITNNCYGIILYQSSNSTIVNNDVSLCSGGISLSSSSYNNIAGNNASSNYHGISLSSSSYNNITGNNASSNSKDGISLSSSSYNNLTRNKMNGNRYNFHISGDMDAHYNNSIDTSNTVGGRPIYYVKNKKDQTYEGNKNAGFFAAISCDNITVKDLVLSNNFDGLLFWKTHDSLIQNVTTRSNCDGISLQYSSFNNITGNNASSNSNDGISLFSSSNNNITGNNASSNSDYGIHLSSSSNNNITGNNASSNGHGIHLFSSSYNNITGNNASSNYYGIYLVHSSKNNIAGNNASSNYHGISLSSSSKNNITGNNASSNSKDGISLSSSSYNNLTRNKMNGNRYNFHISGYTYAHYNNSIDTSNTVGGRPIYYVKNKKDQTYEGNINAGFFAAISCDNITVKDLVLSNNFDGLLFWETDNSLVQNVTTRSNCDGISLQYSSFNNITGNNASSNSDYGISLSSSSNNNITGNNASSNSDYGIHLSSSSNNNITGNNASSNGHGIHLSSSSNNNITGNNASSNSNDGIYLSSSSNNNITGNNASSNYDGIYLSSSSNNNITGNNASLNFGGIFLDSSSNNNITGNNASSNYDGIYLSSSSYNNITGNNASSNSDYGIYLDSSSNNNITGNNASSNSDYGISLDSSSNNNITGNNASSNTYYGISLSSSSYNNLTRNKMNGNRYNFHISGYPYAHYNNSIDTSNTVGGRPIYYVKNKKDQTYEGNINAGFFAAISCDNITVKDLVLSNNFDGLLFWETDNSLIQNVTTRSNCDGISLQYSSFNNITGNNASSNSDYGISLYGSGNNNITGNNASLNFGGIFLDSSSNNNITGNNASLNSGGIFLVHSSYNNITGNNASLNSGGISLFSSSYNNITGNNASSNSNDGIYLYGSGNNLIYNNYFNNTKNAFDDSNNIWNITTKTPGTNIVGGPWLGGNYWSDYKGTDVDGDGLGDTLLPYNCSGNIIHGGDHLPLITPESIGKTIWETNITIDMAPNETKNIITVVPLDMFNDMTGKVELITTLYSDLGQIIAYEDLFFYITDTNTSLILETDKRVYKPNETIAIYGEVKNQGSQPEGYNLSIKKDGAEIFADAFTLNPNETHEFALNTNSNTSFTLEGTLDGVTVTDFVSVETASINVSIIAPDVVGINPFNVGVLIENVGRISADLNVSINSMWNITVPEGESRLLEETTMSITKNTTLNVTISGDVDQTYQKEIFCGENARINITPEPTYLEGTVDIPYIIENIGLLDSEFNATFSRDDQTILESFFIPKGQNITDSVSFNLTIGSHLLQYVSPFEVVNTTLNVLSPPEFVVSSIYPADRNFTIGEDVTLVIEVENIGGSEGEAMLSLEMPDFEDTNRTWIRAGAKENMSFHLTIPDDLEEKNYKGFYVLDGKREEFTFFVQGANISVDASLDKSMYAEGDTAVLTLELTNECELDLDLYSRVKFNAYDSVQNYTLPGSGTETLVFYVPVNFTGDNKMLYTVYMDSGRSLYINSIYIYEEQPEVPLKLFTDKDVYNMGDVVTIHIVDVTSTDVLNLTAPNFTYKDTVSGPMTLDFTLPELRSGTYYIEYTYGNFSSAHPFDVRGYSARIIEAGLDKEVYYSGDIIKLKMNVEANRNVSGLQKTWIYDPENELVDEFAMNKTLMEGENKIEISRTLSTNISGIHVIVYGFSAELSGDSFTMLVSGAEYFDAEAVGLCGDVAPCPDCNDIVDMGDVILLLNNVSYPGDQDYALCNDWAGDCRCNGVRDMGDVILLLNNVSYPEDPRYVLDCC